MGKITGCQSKMQGSNRLIFSNDFGNFTLYLQILKKTFY